MHVHTYLETAALGGQYLELFFSPWPSDFPKVMLKVSARPETKPAHLKPGLTFQNSPAFPSLFCVYTVHTLYARLLLSSFLMHRNTAANLYFSICPVYGTAHFCCKNIVSLFNVSFINHLTMPGSDSCTGNK